MLLCGLQMKHLGTGLIDSDGVTWLTASGNWLLKNDITGSGALVKQGAGNLIINHELTYTGDTTVENGVLIVGDDSVTVPLARHCQGPKTFMFLMAAH